MPIDVIVPPVGESITEGILSEWLKRPGESVQADEPLFSLETDKVNITINAPADGTLSIRVEAGEKVRIGEVVATIEPTAPEAVRAPVPPLVTPAGMPQVEAKLAGAPQQLAPGVRRITRELGIDPATVTGTGRGGRITKADVLDAASARPAELAPAPPSASATSEGPRNLRQTRTPMSPLRQRIAERLVQATHESATVTTFNELDMTGVATLRARHREAFRERHGVDLGLMPFFVKAVVDALEAVPELNAQIQGDELVHNHYYDIGIAVSSEAGLVVPVLRDADRLSLAEVERGIEELSRKVRDGTIALAELSGGVFTISNGGVFGSLLSTPLLNPPQAGILGMHAIQKRPVVIDDQIAIRPMMYLALSYDHRIVDGREAVTFLKRVVSYLESPGFNLLGL